MFVLWLFMDLFKDTQCYIIHIDRNIVQFQPISTIIGYLL